VRPKVVAWKVLEHLNGKDELQSPFYTMGEEMSFEKGWRKAVHLVIQLPKSSYATIALREILHIPSSFEMQMKLNKLYEDQKDS
jgi:tRNA(Glu) U13 pseudouridine synthase TruD